VILGARIGEVDPEMSSKSAMCLVCSTTVYFLEEAG